MAPIFEDSFDFWYDNPPQDPVRGPVDGIHEGWFDIGIARQDMWLPKKQDDGVGGSVLSRGGGKWEQDGAVVTRASTGDPPARSRHNIVCRPDTSQSYSLSQSRSVPLAVAYWDT